MFESFIGLPREHLRWTAGTTWPARTAFIEEAAPTEINASVIAATPYYSEGSIIGRASAGRRSPQAQWSASGVMSALYPSGSHRFSGIGCNPAAGRSSITPFCSRSGCPGGFRRLYGVMPALYPSGSHRFPGIGCNPVAGQVKHYTRRQIHDHLRGHDRQNVYETQISRCSYTQ